MRKLSFKTAMRKNFPDLAETLQMLKYIQVCHNTQDSNTRYLEQVKNSSNLFLGLVTDL